MRNRQPDESPRYWFRYREACQVPRETLTTMELTEEERDAVAVAMYARRDVREAAGGSLLAPADDVINSVLLKLQLPE